MGPGTIAGAMGPGTIAGAMGPGAIAGSMGPGTIAGAMLVEGCRRGCATSASASAVSSRLLLSGREQECW
jgi:hypothetical protein